jgi:hypothetical protein
MNSGKEKGERRKEKGERRGFPVGCVSFLLSPFSYIRPMADPAPERPPADSPQSDACDVCGSTDTWWRSCKLLCRNCGRIVKSCADL